MKPVLLLAGLGITAVTALTMVSCGKSDEPVDKPLTTTTPISLATRPQSDLAAIVNDMSAATRPEDSTSTPVGEVKKVVLPSGVIIEDLRIGKGEEVPQACKVNVVYTGWLDDKTIFDDSRPNGIGASFTIGKKDVVDGWNQGIPGMRVGGVRLLTIPPALGYGDAGQGKIPGKATLHFRIQVLKFAKTSG